MCMITGGSCAGAAGGRLNKRGRGHSQRLRAQRAHKRQRHKPTTSLGCPYCITVAEDRFHEVKVAHHGPGDDEAHLPVHTHPSRIRQAWPQIAACVCVRAFLRQHMRARRTCRLRLSLTNCVCVEQPSFLRQDEKTISRAGAPQTWRYALHTSDVFSST